MTKNGELSYTRFCLLALLAVAFILIISLDDPSDPLDPSSKPNLKESPPGETKFKKPYGRLKETSETYAQVKNLPIKEAIELLKAKGEKIREKIPNFPKFPQIWLLPSKTRGPYSSIPERYAIEFMELLYPGHRFLKSRPTWLKNLRHCTGRCLELDGFCPELGIAIEYNGRQHYEWPNYTGMSQKEFQKQQERDQFKEEVCRKNKIILIKIPYTVPLERIPLAIYSKLIDQASELRS